MDRLLLPEERTHIHTDHRNILFVFIAIVMESSTARHVISNPLRWGLHLSRFPYMMEHVLDDENIMSDIMTRWLNAHRRNRMAIRRITSKVPESSVLSSLKEDQESILNMNNQSLQHNSGDLSSTFDTEQVLWTHKRKLWVLHKDINTRYAILISSHCDTSGHRDIDSS